jgi:hypothetical protein
VPTIGAAVVVAVLPLAVSGPSGSASWGAGGAGGGGVPGTVAVPSDAGGAVSGAAGG